MRKLISAALLFVSGLPAATPNITGVWKADLNKSKIAGPPITSYLAQIDLKEAVINRRTGEKAPQITDTSAALGQHGEERTVLTFFDNGKPMVRPFQGIPTRLTTTSDGNTVKVTGEISGRPSTFKRTYELSPDGQTLTITMIANNEGKEATSTYVLLKQPDSAAEALQKPEETAAAHFKNVKTDSLKDLPISEFINNMRYFSWSLGKNCEFCHVKNKFDVDDKKEKKTARQMIDMVASIDKNNFEGHPAVRCFTCHEAHDHPPSRPPYADEVGSAEAGKAAYQTTTAQQH